MTKKLSFEYVNSRLIYEPDTGYLYWRTSRYKSIIGTRAGILRPDGYRAVMLENYPYYEHRLIWLLLTKEWPAETVDHINHKRDDNRRENLRAISYTENNMNTEFPKPNKTGFTGVRQDRTGLFFAVYHHQYLGTFKTAEEASLAYRFHKAEAGRNLGAAAVFGIEQNEEFYNRAKEAWE